MTFLSLFLAIYLIDDGNKSIYFVPYPITTSKMAITSSSSVYSSVSGITLSYDISKEVSPTYYLTLLIPVANQWVTISTSNSNCVASLTSSSTIISVVATKSLSSCSNSYCQVSGSPLNPLVLDCLKNLDYVKTTTSYSNTFTATLYASTTAGMFEKGTFALSLATLQPALLAYPILTKLVANTSPQVSTDLSITLPLTSYLISNGATIILTLPQFALYSSSTSSTCSGGVSYTSTLYSKSTD